MLHNALLFGLLTGMRSGEICGLMAEDITAKGNLGRFVSIRPNEVRLLKSKAAEREVPLHGILEQLLDTALPTSGRLFPYLTVDKVVKRYAYLRRRYPELRGTVFHSTRKWFITQCERTGVPEHFTATLVGHHSARSANKLMGWMALAPTGVVMRYTGVEICIERSHPMEVTTIGLVLAKNIFQVHGITKDEEVAFNWPLRRAQLLPFFSKLEPCLIGMEACSSAHHWGRELTALGHDVRLIPQIYVKPYVKRGKSDAIDAEAICEAVTHPTMRFVAIKAIEQQALLSLHRARSLLVHQRTQLINGLRGMVAEFGVYIARGLARVIGFAEDILMGEVLDLPEIANEVIHNLCEHLMALHTRIRWYENRLKLVAKEDTRVRLLRTIPGVDAVTASAIIASIGDGHQFSNGREFAAWLGLTPANKSSGG